MYKVLSCIQVNKAGKCIKWYQTSYNIIRVPCLYYNVILEVSDLLDSSNTDNYKSHKFIIEIYDCISMKY